MTTPDKKYLPTTEAWERYKESGGSASYGPRAINMEHDILVGLSGIIGYWWRRDQLVEVPSLVVDETIVIQPGQTKAPQLHPSHLPHPPHPPPSAIGVWPGPPLEEIAAMQRHAVTGWIAYLSVPISELNSDLHEDGTLFIQEDDREDPECTGSDCEDCGGTGCEITPDSVTAREVIDHFYRSNTHDVTSAAREFDVSPETIDDILLDVVALLDRVKVHIPR